MNEGVKESQTLSTAKIRPVIDHNSEAVQDRW